MCWWKVKLGQAGPAYHLYGGVLGDQAFNRWLSEEESLDIKVKVDGSGVWMICSCQSLKLFPFLY